LPIDSIGQADRYSEHAVGPGLVSVRDKRWKPDGHIQDVELCEDEREHDRPGEKTPGRPRRGRDAEPELERPGGEREHPERRSGVVEGDGEVDAACREETRGKNEKGVDSTPYRFVLSRSCRVYADHACAMRRRPSVRAASIIRRSTRSVMSPVITMGFARSRSANVSMGFATARLVTTK